MRKVEFLDTSLRDGEQTPGVNFSIKEKIAIAKQLEKWGISAIEAGFPAASPDSFTAVQEIAKVLTKTAVTGLARSVKSDIDACYEALKDAKYPQVHVFIATSPIHREFKLNKTKEEILEAIKEHVSYARSKFEIVEFSPEDATRTELDFLLQVVQTAVDAGASYINIPDTVGFTTPAEYGAIFKYLIDHVFFFAKINFLITANFIRHQICNLFCTVCRTKINRIYTHFYNLFSLSLLHLFNIGSTCCQNNITGFTVVSSKSI